MTGGYMAEAVTVEWLTPQFVMDFANQAYGTHTLDAAATDENHLCQYWYTEEDDALTRPWNGNVWLNAPYGRQLGKWIDKAISEILAGNAHGVTLLLPARMDTIWMHKLLKHGQEFWFIQGRLKYGRFVGDTEANSAPFPSVVVRIESRSIRRRSPAFYAITQEEMRCL